MAPDFLSALYSNIFKKIKGVFSSEIVTVPVVLKKSYFRPVDGLRGIAILLVVLAHSGINHFTRAFHVILGGRIGVDLFFVISGFLITTLLIREKVTTGKISLRYFFIRRALRIIPVVYLFLIILIILNLYYNLKIPLPEFILSFLFLKDLPLKNYNNPLTAHLWSLAVEGQFYITFPFLLSANINRYFITSLLFIIIIPLLSIFGFYYAGLPHLSTYIQWVVKTAMYLFWNGPVMILIGSVFSILVYKGLIKTEWVGKTYYLGFFLFVTAIIIQSRTFVYYHTYVSEYLAVLILGYCTVLSVKTDDLLSAILKNRILVNLGIMSYSIYIWQQLFLGWHPWEPWLNFLHNYSLALFNALKLICLLIIAFISWYFYESRFMKLKKRFKTTIAPMAVITPK